MTNTTSIFRAAILAASVASFATPASALTVVSSHSGWNLYSNDGEGGKICFLATPPATTEPANLNRDPALLYISSWPKDGVKSEISVKLGFPARKSPEPSAAITGASASSYKLTIKDDRGFVIDSTLELKMLDAMKKGSKLTVQATSERGTTVTDTYSLNGLTAALQALATGCP